MTPTQAQIAAALSAYAAEITKIYDQGKSLTIEHRRKAMTAALTAAAEAGEQEPDEMCLRVGHKWVIECQRCGDNRAVQSEIIATIERCAQVAEWEGYATVGRQIAAAIRTLKEEG